MTAPAAGTPAPPVATVAPETWRLVRSETGRFEVLLPGTPTPETSERATLMGAVHSGEYRAELEGSGFRIEFHDLPAIASWVVSRDAILQRAQRTFLDESEAVERHAEPWAVGQDYPARRLSYDSRGERGEALFVVAGNRLFILVANRLSPCIDRAQLEGFFTSFRVLDPADSARPPQALH